MVWAVIVGSVAKALKFIVYKSRTVREDASELTLVGPALQSIKEKGMPFK